MIRNIYILLLLSLLLSQPDTEWTQVNIPSNQNIVKLISDGNGLYGATSTASIYFSSDNGLNWESLPLHPDIFPYGVDLFDKVGDYLFFSQNIGGSTYNYRTYYNGANWEDWEILPYDESIIYEFVHYDNTIYALLNQGISVSSDYGTSWELIDTPSITGYIHLQYVDDQYLYINHGCILYRYNIETFEWVDITGILDDIGPPEPYSCTSIHQIEKFNDKLLISMYWYGGVGTLFYSQNNGDSWDIINSFPSLSNSGYGTNNVSAVATKNGILYAGTATSEDGIYYTQNLIDWTDYSVGLSNYNLSVSELTVTEENIYKLGGSVNLFQNELIGVCDEGYTEIDGECYYQSDLDVVQDFIDSNESLYGYSPITLTSPNNWLNGHLKTFLLYDRGITSIPESIGNLDSLDMIYFFENEIESVPESIGNLINLTFLDLGRNNISNIPDTIWGLENLTTLNFQENQLTSISDEVCNIYSNLEYGPFLSMNQICPPYPECLTEENIGYQDTSECFLCEDGYVELWGECYTITFTTYLDLSEMGLSGEIPSEIGDLTNLSNLDLGGNQLSGEIPSEIGNLNNLTVLDFGGNQLSGEIPSEICNLNNLSVLDLGGNQLSGEIPSEICNLTNLTELELGGNQLSGEIPSCVGNLNNLTFLHLEYNQFSGEIPFEIGNLTNLIWLNFVHNQLTGEIPSSICNLDMNWSDPNNFNISKFGLGLGTFIGKTL